MDDRIADMLGKWGGTGKKLQQKCPLEHPCAGENTIKSPLALAADGVPSGLIFEWRKRDVRSDVSCSTFGDFSMASAPGAGALGHF